MKLLTTIIFSVCFFTTSTFAQSGTGETITVRVNGLVCDFCARATEKVFGKQDAVESIKVNLDAGLVTILTKANQKIDDATIKQLINESGYDVVKITH
jgi:copper chaperone CopZ